MNKSILIGLLILVLGLAGCSKVTPISEEITMELGQTLSEDPGQFVNVSDEALLSEMTMDFSEIDFEKVGDYTANAVYGEEKCPITIHIVDTTAPEAELIASCALSRVNVDVNVVDFFAKMEDKTEVTAGFVDFTRIGDLQEMSDEALAAIEMPTAMHDALEETEFQETMKFTQEGEYLVKVAVKDTSGNLTWFEVPVFADGTAPVISGFKDQNIAIDKLEGNSNYDASTIKAIDAFDGDITDSDRAYFKEEIIEATEEKMTIKVHLYAVDRAGNQAEETFMVNATVDMEKILKDAGLIKTVPVYPDPYFDRSLAEEAFAKVNEQRAAHGVAALAWDESMYQLACERAQEIMQSFSHTRLDGTPITDYGYGENIAENYISATSVMNGWMNSQGHKENLLDARYYAGVMACYRANGGYYWVNLFRP